MKENRKEKKMMMNVIFNNLKKTKNQPKSWFFVFYGLLSLTRESYSVPCLKRRLNRSKRMTIDHTP